MPGKDMLSVTQEWNPNQKKLLKLLSSSDQFDEGKVLCLQMHNELHDITKGSSPTIYQSLLDGLSSEMMVYRPIKSFSSIAWNLWHITRIEDAISNILIGNSKQVFNKEWQEKINLTITDTGNAFTTIDVDQFNKIINTKELLKYRKAVGKNTQKILQNINQSEKKRKPIKEQLQRIIDEKVLTNEKESIWLLDFWANKTINGLLLMPITRHQIVHINDSFKIKERYIKNFV
jgi:hypothetical protein